MTNQEIFELMDRFDRSTALSMKVTLGDFALELDRRGAAAVPAALPAAGGITAAPAAEEPPCIRAPLVGTFCASASPEKPPFVAVGDHVAKGQTVCLIEAMKMMSEVAAPCDCVIEEVLLADGALAAFDAPLFRYRAV